MLRRKTPNKVYIIFTGIELNLKIAKTKSKTSKYDEVFTINASFDEIIKKSVDGNPKPKPKEIKADKKKSK